ncbi:unnamed protein product, partial [Effrenium voratum]
AKLPEPWVVTRDEQQRVCFHNKATRQTKWHHPLEPVFKELAAVCLEVLSMSAKDRYDHLHRLHTEGTRRAEEEMGQWNEVTVEDRTRKSGCTTTTPAPRSLLAIIPSPRFCPLIPADLQGWHC